MDYFFLNVRLSTLFLAVQLQRGFFKGSVFGTMAIQRGSFLAEESFSKSLPTG